MKKTMALMALALCSSLMAGTSFAEDLHYVWPPADCGWVGGCRYTYRVPNPPAGKRWALELESKNSVNDGNVWMIGGNGKVAMDRWDHKVNSYGQISRWHWYRGSMPTGGEVEFWMPGGVARPSAIEGRYNQVEIRGTLVDANTPQEKRPW